MRSANVFCRSCAGSISVQVHANVQGRRFFISNQQDKKNARIDYRAGLANDAQRAIFDRLKAVRLQLAKEKQLKATYLVGKDEHLVQMIQNPKITEEEIKNLPNSSNILLKKFAHELYTEYQKILEENRPEGQIENLPDTPAENPPKSLPENPLFENLTPVQEYKADEKDKIPF